MEPVSSTWTGRWADVASWHPQDKRDRQTKTQSRAAGDRGRCRGWTRGKFSTTGAFFHRTNTGTSPGGAGCPSKQVAESRTTSPSQGEPLNEAPRGTMACHATPDTGAARRVSPTPPHRQIVRSGSSRPGSCRPETHRRRGPNHRPAHPHGRHPGKSNPSKGRSTKPHCFQ